MILRRSLWAWIMHLLDLQDKEDTANLAILQRDDPEMAQKMRNVLQRLKRAGMLHPIDNLESIEQSTDATRGMLLQYVRRLQQERPGVHVGLQTRRGRRAEAGQFNLVSSAQLSQTHAVVAVVRDELIDLARLEPFHCVKPASRFCRNVRRL